MPAHVWVPSLCYFIAVLLLARQQRRGRIKKPLTTKTCAQPFINLEPRIRGSLFHTSSGLWVMPYFQPFYPWNFCRSLRYFSFKKGVSSFMLTRINCNSCTLGRILCAGVADTSVSESQRCCRGKQLLGAPGSRKILVGAR